MAATFYRFRIESVTEGPNNRAIMTFQTKDSLNPPIMDLSLLIAYVMTVLEVSSYPCFVQGVSTSTGPNSPTIDEAYPNAHMDSLSTVYDFLPAADSFGTLRGHGNAAPRGSSVCVSELQLGGSRRNGRHYIPWLSADQVTPTGNFSPLAQPKISNLWHQLIQQNGPVTAIAASVPCTVGPNHTPIYDVRASGNVARLKSRRR
jgi:hypothetical protein